MELRGIMNENWTRVLLDSSISQLCAPEQSTELLWASDPKKGCTRPLLRPHNLVFPEIQPAASLVAGLSIIHKGAPHFSTEREQQAKPQATDSLSAHLPLGHSSHLTGSPGWTTNQLAGLGSGRS